ncbi:MAG: pantoate--beta-alanine ligase [Pseudomonadota bacterium]
MQTCIDIADVRRVRDAWRAQGERVACVPTMGNLHAGHLDLVRHARAAAERVVVSIFVNPLQFGPQEDFQRYPRTEQADAEALRAAGVDVLFLPSVQVMYPRPLEATTRVEVPGISNDLCGAFRPALFRGVATVVARLFNIVQPTVAIFGEKDFQQLFIIRRMVEDLAFAVDIVGIPTVREPHGLALSSRNGYLDAAQRQQAGILYQTLTRLAQRLAGGARDYADMQARATEDLKSSGFRPDYVAIRRVSDLGQPRQNEVEELVILIAAWLDQTRLIDNLRVVPGAASK